MVVYMQYTLFTRTALTEAITPEPQTHTQPFYHYLLGPPRLDGGP